MFPRAAKSALPDGDRTCGDASTMACSVAAGKAGRPLARSSGPQRRYEETSADCVQELAGRPRGAVNRRPRVILGHFCGPIFAGQLEREGLFRDVVLGKSLRPLERAAAHRSMAGAVNPRATSRRVGGHAEKLYKPQYVARELGDVDGRCPGGLTRFPGALDAVFGMLGRVHGPQHTLEAAENDDRGVIIRDPGRLGNWQTST
ncbi:hypothetical protein OH76DRAFT_1562256 [Lentinus brumalis]|uniref:Uncharacterized protein n=1 Tax=Lentinus brumalis TaxID=2498619 RepID=A0A371CIC8_9APHY|nr:hypothetical protein OH76DRAFT_1562256 [Polyporus brumalis]